MVRAQSALRHTGLAGVPMFDVENACASASSAFHLAWLAIRSGQYRTVLVVGAEKLTHPDKQRSFDAIGRAIDLEDVDRVRAEIYGADAPAGTGTLFMDIYAAITRRYMRASGATPADFAAVAVKNRRHGHLNPLAQYRDLITVDDVLGSRTTSDPLTLLMCSPIGDGAAAVLLTAASPGGHADAVRVLASTVVSGSDVDPSPAAERAARGAYAQAALGPEDLDLAEVHDAAAPAEMIIYEELGIAAPGEAPKLLATGAATLGGRIPVNVSGGLLSKGHPVSATGCAQLVELTEQLRGRAGQRQVERARIGLAENAGGYLGPDQAVAAVTILGG